MMRYEDIKTWASAQFKALGYKPLPMFSPGPASDALVQKMTANQLVFLTIGGGAGLATEGTWDRPFLTTRCIGPQMNYDLAEKLASDLDDALLAVDSGTEMGSTRVQPITRSGGAPMLLMLDTGNRYHFTCSYIVENQRIGAA